MKRFLCCMAAAWIFLGLCGCSGENVPENVLLDQAHEKAVAGNWKMTESLAGKVLKRNKDNVDALLMSALAKSNLGDDKGALDCALHAAALRKDLFLCQYIKGMLLYKSRKYDLAMAPLQEARKLRSGDLNTLVLLSKCSWELKKYAAARGVFAEIAGHSRYRRSPIIWNAMGCCTAYLSPRKALSFFRMAERVSPEYALTSLNTAVLYDRYLGNPLQAQRSYERFLEQSIGRLELDTVRARVELRLDSMKSN